MLKDHINEDGIMVGVSAGSIVTANNLKNNLGLLNCYLNVHYDNGNEVGHIDILNCHGTKLTDKQAIYLSNIDCGDIIE